MDIYKAIQALYEEKKRLDQLIASLEELQKSGGHELIRMGTRRRGRKYMSPEERLQVSERMKKYWAQRKRQSRNGQPRPDAAAEA